MTLRIPVGLLIAAVFLGSECLSAQSSQTPGNKGFPLRVHGFLLGNYSSRTNGAHPLGRRFLWADERFRLEMSGDAAKERLSFLFKGDLYHDAVANRVSGVVREAYLDLAAGRADLRLGRQIVTWGVGDLLFVNDVFPKDWSAFFSGRPLEYLKV